MRIETLYKNLIRLFTGCIKVIHLRPQVSVEVIDWEKLVKYNIEKINQLMREFDLDGIIITSTDNFRWLTGVPIEHSWYYTHIHTAVHTKGADEPAIIALEGYDETEKMWFRDVRTLFFGEEAYQPIGMNRWVELCVSVLKDHKISDGRLGLDPDTPYIFKDALEEKLTSAEIVDAREILRKARITKSPEEIKAIKVACTIGEMGMKAALETIREGKREREVAAEVLRAFSSYGAEGIIGMPYVVSGNRPTFLPTTEKIIRTRELVLVDLGCVYGGYHSDFCRTVYVGDPPSNLIKIYESLLEAHLAGIKAIKPGVTNKEIYDIVKNKLLELTEGKYDLGWFLGHGLGLGVHEEPIFGDASHANIVRLEEGMYFCLEPAIILPEGRLGIEDDIIVTENGAEVLTRTERETITLKNG